MVCEKLDLEIWSYLVNQKIMDVQKRVKERKNFHHFRCSGVYLASKDIVFVNFTRIFYANILLDLSLYLCS